MAERVLVLPLEAVGLEAISSVGGKNASLGQMIRELYAQGVSVPGGFATTAAAYRYFISAGALQQASDRGSGRRGAQISNCRVQIRDQRSQ